MIRIFQVACMYLALTISADARTIEAKAKVTPEKGGKEQEVNVSLPKSEPQVSVKERAFDYQRAFRYLRQANPSAKIYMIIDGISLDGIEEVKVMPNGTVMVVKYRTHKGLQSKIVKVEDISELGQR